MSFQLLPAFMEYIVSGDTLKSFAITVPISPFNNLRLIAETSPGVSFVISECKRIDFFLPFLCCSCALLTSSFGTSIPHHVFLVIILDIVTEFTLYLSAMTFVFFPDKVTPIVKTTKSLI